MPIVREIPLENSLSSSSIERDSLSKDERLVRDFAKSMLQGRLFIGTFQEKRYVADLNSYRDVIQIHEAETELKHDLEVVKRRLQRFYHAKRWVGITGPDVIGAPTGHCIWVQLDEEVFGCYWYKIRSVHFRHNEVLLKLKIIRKVMQSRSTTPTRIIQTTNTDNRIENFFLMVKNHFENFKDNIGQNIKHFFTSVLTWQNTKEAIIFISLLTVTIATGFVHFLRYSADYFLKFMDEISKFINATTPVMLACVDLIGKVIGGFYLLIAMMWRDHRMPRQFINNPNRRALPQTPYNRF